MLLHGAVFIALLAFIQLAVCAQDYYKLLDVDRSASDKDLKLAYRRLSKKFHPDKNPGDNTAHDKFVEVSEAYDVLRDPALRKVYDRYGHDGVQQHRNGGGGNGNHDPFDLFSRFFGGHGHSGRHANEPRGHNVEIRVEISLRDFYNGAETEFKWNKQVICEKCEGTGSEDGQVDVCNVCGGHGARIVKKQIVPGMFQQIQMRCDACGGRGKTIKHKCPACEGQRVIREHTTVPLKVQRGASRDARLIYENEADESPEWIAGDLVVTLSEKTASHEDNPDKVDGIFFRRKDNDLYWTELLSLREAWMGGWSRNLTHLDKHVVHLGRPQGQVIQPGHVETIVGQGMPIWDQNSEDIHHEMQYGNLYVEYTVVLPDQMDSAMEKEFRGLFDKFHAQKGVNLDADSGRQTKEQEQVKDEL